MKSVYLSKVAPFALVIALSGASVAGAQNRQPTPEQRIERLERQLRQLQRQVFPKGQPADTAGFSDEPAATATSVRTLDERLNGIERQLSEVLRQSEENGHRLGTVEADVARARADSDQRLQALEKAGAAAAESATAAETAPAETAEASPPPPSRPKIEKPKPKAKPEPKPEPEAEADALAADSPATPAAKGADPGEQAYDEGFQLWKAGKYDQAITALRAMASSFPGHRRASWARNLAGRALLDKGQPRAAAEALLANYRGNPKGERAADSLFYLGQALMKLGQPGQACKAYGELEDVYGASMRGELRRLLGPAKSAASCG